MCIYLFIYVVYIDQFQFIILASAALCCTAFAYPIFEEYQYAGHDLSSHDTDNFDSGSYQPVASSRIGVHELGGHDDEHVDYYVCIRRHICNEHHIYLFRISKENLAHFILCCGYLHKEIWTSKKKKQKFIYDFFSSYNSKSEHLNTPEMGKLRYAYQLPCSFIKYQLARARQTRAIQTICDQMMITIGKLKLTNDYRAQASDQ